MLKKLMSLFLTITVITVSFFTVQAIPDYMIIHQPTTEEPYVAVTNSYSASYQWFEVKEDGTGNSVDGQNTNKLKQTPDGNEYFCKISWKDGTELISDTVTNSYAIIHQPSAAEPYVTLNNSSGAEFQWYRNTYDSKTVVRENPAENELAITQIWSGNFADGIWSGDGNNSVDIEFELKPNQILTITPNEGFDGTVENYGEKFLSENSGIYTYHPNGYENFNLCIEDTKDFSASIKILTLTESIPVDGQTTEKLTATVDSEYYYCKISGNNGTELSSGTVRLDYSISHQPTAAEPYTEINSTKQATFFWYEVCEKTYTITENTYSENERPISDLWLGSYSSDKWHSNSAGTFEALIYLRKGQTAVIALPDNFEGGIGGLRNENGSYFYTATTNEKFYIYLKNSQPFSFNIFVKEFENKNQIPVSTQKTLGIPADAKKYRCEITVDGTIVVSETFTNTYTITHQPTQTETYVETNSSENTYQWYKAEKKLYTVVDKKAAENELATEHIYIGTYNDSLWSSDSGKIDIELNLKKNDILIVSPSESFDGTVSEYDGNKLSFFEGIHTFVAQKDGLFDLYAFSKNISSDFSASVHVLRGVKGVMIDSETDYSFTPISNGEYMCVVNFADGTDVSSDSFEFAEGILEKLEKELDEFHENIVNEDNLTDITNIVKTLGTLTAHDDYEASKIKNMTERCSYLIGIITEKSNRVSELALAVESYDINKVVPSDEADLIGLKDDITELKKSSNLSNEQKNKLSELIEICDSLIQKISSMNISVSIANNPIEREIKYGETIVLSAVATDMPYGAKIVWYVNGSAVSEGNKFRFSPESDSLVTVKLADGNGNVIYDKAGNEISNSQQINVKSNFFIKLINFFKKLLGINQTIIQTIF